MSDEQKEPSRLYEFRDIDWSEPYKRIGEFITEFEKIPTSLRFLYNCLLQRNGLSVWKLGSFILRIETIGPAHLSLCLCAAIRTLYPDDNDLIAEAEAIHKETTEIAQVRNEIAHGEWHLGPKIVIIHDSAELPQRMGRKRKLTMKGEKIVDLPTLNKLIETIERTRSLVRRIKVFQVATDKHTEVPS